ncbi:MAG: RpiB/LacA/LacB family sugar-phosphate isomerase [Candidatus Scalinduaceae bacterium]
MVRYGVLRFFCPEGTQNRRGIVTGGTGIGNGILANKVKGIRAGVVYDEYSAKKSREHNDANVMTLGARVLTVDKAKKVVKLWLNTPFSNEERHKRRIGKIKKLESDNF